MNRISLLLQLISSLQLVSCILFFISKGKLEEEVAARKAADKVTRETLAKLTKASEEIDSLSTLKREQEALSNTNRKLESTSSEMYTARQEVFFNTTMLQLSAAKKSIKIIEENAKLLRNDLLQAEQSLASNNNEIELENLNAQIAELQKNNADLNESLEIALWELEIIINFKIG